MDCVICGEPITTPAQRKEFGLCDVCLEETESNQPASIADYWQQCPPIQQWIREYAHQGQRRVQRSRKKGA